MADRTNYTYLVTEDKLWDSLLEAYELGLKRGEELSRLKPGEISTASPIDELRACGNRCREVTWKKVMNEDKDQ